jgi:hypothetical protein
MRDAGLPRGIEEKLGGWASSGSEAMEGYGRGYKMEVLADWLSKIEFCDVDVS